MRFLLKRWRFWLGAFVLMGLLSYGLNLILVPRTGVTQANFNRIKVGMTKEKVFEIVGELPFWGCIEASSEDGAFVECFLWKRDPDVILVTFADARVKKKDIHLETIWKRFGRQYGHLLRKSGL